MTPIYKEQVSEEYELNQNTEDLLVLNYRTGRATRHRSYKDVIEFTEKYNIKKYDIFSKVDLPLKNEQDKRKEIENFFKSFLTDLMIFTTPDYPNSVFYIKDDEIIFELQQNPNNKGISRFLVDYCRIWGVFNSKFNLNDDEIRSFIKGEVEETLKLGTVTPSSTVRYF